MRRYSAKLITVPLLVALVVAATAGVSAAKGQPATPTMKSALSSPSVSVGSSDTDTVTMTGKAKNGSPTGTVTFNACGPTANRTPCTAPNMGSATVSLSPGTKNRSTAGTSIIPTVAGWYCFLDEYNGDTHYKPVSDNSAKTECFDATGSSTHPITPTLKSALSSSSIPFGSTAVDTATVTGTAADGSPTGTLTFYACGPTASATACTSPNVGPATEEVTLESGDRSTASVTIEPGAPGWYCFLDEYSGDSNYNPVTDNDTATECLDVTGSSATGNGATSSTVMTTG